MPINSQKKGKNGEREFAKIVKELFDIDMQRNLQSRDGGKNNPDLEGMEGFHWEIKREERFRIRDAQKQALADCAGQIPAIGHRYNNDEWWVMTPLRYLEAFCVHFLEARGWQCVKETA